MPSDTAMAAGSTPAPKNLAARFVGIITSPRDTFQSVAVAPKWLGMLIVTSVIIAVFSALPMTTDAGKQAALDMQEHQLQSFGMQVSDQMHANLERGAARLPYTTGISVLLVGPIFAVIIAGILFAIFNAGLGGEASFKQVFSVYVHSGVIGALSLIFSGTINYFRATTGSVANLGALLPMIADTSFPGRLLGMVDVFMIWSVIVLAMGLGVLYRRRTQPIAISLLSVYAVIVIVVALVKSRLGAA
ncbi:MAG: YIP1 family protein [Vicinamibacterales bacterium]